MRSRLVFWEYFMRFVLLFSILLSGLLFSQGAETYPDAVQALQRQDYFGAQIISERLLEKTPNDARVLRILGESLYYQKRYEQAAEIYERLSKRQPLEKKDSLLYANTLVFLKEYETASVVLERLVEKDSDVEALYLLGRVKLELGEGDVAIDFLNRAYLIDPQKAPEDFNSLKERSLEIRAISLRKRAEERAKAREQRAEEAEKRGDLTEEEKTNLSFKRRKKIPHDQFVPFTAVDETQKELELFKIFEPPPSRLEKIDATLLENFDDANSLFSKELFDEAVTNYNAIIEKDNNFVEAFYQKGIALYATGDYRGAIIEFDKVLKLDRDFIRAMYWKASAHEKIDEIDKALDDFIIARKLALQTGDAFVLFDGSVHIARLVRRGAKSKFFVEVDPEKVTPVEEIEDSTEVMQKEMEEKREVDAEDQKKTQQETESPALEDLTSEENQSPVSEDPIFTPKVEDTPVPPETLNVTPPEGEDEIESEDEIQ